MEKVELMLDSGAFSAWKKQEEINIEDYILFCKENLPYISWIVNLDIIPGKWGDKKLSKEVVEKSARQGWKNYEYMIRKGIPKEKLIHIFHQGENFKWLEKIAGEMDYIGLSPANDRTTIEKTQWLDKCMDYVTDQKGLPTVKFHGFAVTSNRLVYRYPWYSVDSTSWVMTSRFGSVYVPRRRQNKYVYDENSWKITFSLKSPSIKEEGKHYSTLTQIEKKEIDKYLKSKGFELGESKIRKVEKGYKLKDGEKWFGKEDADSQRSIYGDRSGYVKEGWQKDRMVETIISPGLCNDYKLRDELNIIYYKNLEASMPKWPWPFIQSKQTKLGVFS